MKVLKAIFPSQMFCALPTEGFASPRRHYNTSLHLAIEEMTAVVDVADLDFDLGIDPKEVVKVFGRLAEKYIMVDESGSMCRYFICKNCEFRLPGGGFGTAYS